MQAAARAIAYAHDHQSKSLQSLQDFLRIPSISTLPEHEKDIQRAAQWAADRLKDLGFEKVQVVPTARHPVVLGQRTCDRPSAPTVLVYGHYDVQPVDPLDEWQSPPFEPTIRGENLYARGASDMKAQIVAFFSALEALAQTEGIPVNMKIMLEGEEEIGSPSLQAFLQDHRQELACDFCLNTDASILGPDTPALTYALRGLAYFEIHVYGPRSDLHSGLFGGVVDNPANVLSRLLGNMIDQNGRITLPGFYDPVRPLSPEERRALARLPQDENWWKERAGVERLGGEEGYTSTERATARPTLDVNGLYSGFIGQGSKTVLPARAMAKISMRLVPDQTPEQVKESLRQYLEENCPPTVRWELKDLTGCLPGMIDIQSAPVLAAKRALQSVWGVEPFFSRQGGSVPVVGMIQDLLGVQSLMLGFGLPDDNLHAPNEKQHLPTFYRGIDTYIHFLNAVAEGT